MKIFKNQSVLYKYKKTYGISLAALKRACIYNGGNPTNRFLKLKKHSTANILKTITNSHLHDRIKRKKTILFFWNIKLYRGIRHMLRLPARGQRTHTNAKTKRKFNFFEKLGINSKKSN